MKTFVATSTWELGADGAHLVLDGVRTDLYRAYDSDDLSLLVVRAGDSRGRVTGLSCSTNGRQAGNDTLRVRAAVVTSSLPGDTEPMLPLDIREPSPAPVVVVDTDSLWDTEAPVEMWGSWLSPVAGVLDVHWPQLERPVVPAGGSFWLNLTVGTLVESLRLTTTITFEV